MLLLKLGCEALKLGRSLLRASLVSFQFLRLLFQLGLCKPGDSHFYRMDLAHDGGMLLGPLLPLIIIFLRQRPFRKGVDDGLSPVYQRVVAVVRPPLLVVLSIRCCSRLDSSRSPTRRFRVSRC